MAGLAIETKNEIDSLKAAFEDLKKKLELLYELEEIKEALDKHEVEQWSKEDDEDNSTVYEVEKVKWRQADGQYIYSPGYFWVDRKEEPRGPHGTREAARTQEKYYYDH